VSPLATTKATPAVTIGGRPAPVAFSGLAPGIIGLYQINATVPLDAPAGRQPIIVTVNNVQSKASSIPVQ
jgi:uncharacterized protein (TIGR03437 family)